MKLELAGWPEGSTPKEFEETAEDLDIVHELYRFTDPVLVNALVQKSSNEVVVEGRLRTTAYGNCVRCLDDVRFEIEEPFRLIGEIVPDKQVGEDSGDPDFTLLRESEPVWDLTGAMRELILLAIPDNPLCRDDCAGLCPRCGINRNRETCQCEVQATGNPMARLGDLINKRRSDK